MGLSRLLWNWPPSPGDAINGESAREEKRGVGELFVPLFQDMALD